ncbi:hypothetical protein GX865_02345 [Candidatus Saccharibacteria bacterium]|jgi:hypothetical protein|nr:hypothetical protein [Candidatus Saccharibacteria bacterium]
MKKLTSKLTRKKQVKKPTRITNETVAEHREQILAGARRFKYPVQYTKYRLIISAISIGIVTLLLFILLSWWQLYKVQSTSEFFYRMTRLIPVPVANIDGENVKYGDYLLNYKSAETYLNTVEKLDQKADSESVKGQFDYIKFKAMEKAIEDAYASKLARENSISISSDQIDAAIKRIRQTTSPQGEISQEVYDRSSRQLYGLSPEDSRYNVMRSILRQEVSYSIDERARKVSDNLSTDLKKSKFESGFDKLTAVVKKKYPELEVSTSGWVKKSNPDGGIALAAARLKKGDIAGPIKPFSGDGYYFVQLIDQNKDGQISYGQIKVPLLEFNRRIESLKSDGGVKYYISVPDIQPQINTKS